MRRVVAVAAAAVLCLLPVTGMAALQAFVSGKGSDSNIASGCSRAAPCRTFQAAHGVVDPGGEIIAVDTAGYGALFITKSLTIMAMPGVIASITTSANQTAVFFPAGAGSVVLRNLNFVNVGGGTSNGVDMWGGVESLSIERCMFSGFFVAVHASKARLRVVDTIIRSSLNGIIVTQGASAEVVRSHLSGKGTGEGVTVVQSNDGTTSSVSITDSTASGFWRGFAARNATIPNGPVRLSCMRCTASGNAEDGFHASAATGTVLMTVASSLASGNGRYGFFQESWSTGTATFLSSGDNASHGNGADTSGTITVVGGN